MKGEGSGAVGGRVSGGYSPIEGVPAVGGRIALVPRGLAAKASDPRAGLAKTSPSDGRDAAGHGNWGAKNGSNGGGGIGRRGGPGLGDYSPIEGVPAVGWRIALVPRGLAAKASDPR